MEESFRLFVEECDGFQASHAAILPSQCLRILQGVNLLSDSTSFGSFSVSLLTAFRDEFPKTPALVFPVLSNAVPPHVDADDVRVCDDLCEQYH